MTRGKMQLQIRAVGALNNIGNAYLSRGDFLKAKIISLKSSDRNTDRKQSSDCGGQYEYWVCYLNSGKIDSAIIYFKYGLHGAQEMNIFFTPLLCILYWRAIQEHREFDSAKINLKHALLFAEQVKVTSSSHYHTKTSVEFH